MKKFLLAVCLVSLLSSVSFAAVSDDIYVRQDVFDAKMEALFLRLHSEIANLGNKIDGDIKALNEKIDGVNKSLSEKIDGVSKSLTEKIDGVSKSLTEKIDGVNKSLTEKIDGVNNTLSGRIDSLDSRISDLRNGFYLVSVLFGILLGLPYYNRWQEERREKRKAAFTPSFTLEDVKKLIEENNIKIGVAPQI